MQAQQAYASSKGEISKVAQSITVLIQDARNPQNSGSGVIIKREGQSYTVLTAQHVVQSALAFKVMTLDEKPHLVNKDSVQSFPGVDLAIIRFTSADVYNVAKMGDSSQSPLGTSSFVAGFPGTTVVRSEPSFYFTSGEIAANSNRPFKDGYSIAYSNPTLPGMSGGPVLNENMELIGIHGRAESIAVPQNIKLREDIYVLKTEFNYAVPINTFLRLAPQVNSTLAFKVPSALITNAPNPGDYMLQALGKSKAGDFKGAIADYNKAIQILPTFSPLYLGRGQIRSALGDSQGAIADYDQAIRLNPNDVRAYNNRGVLHARLGDSSSALKDYDQAIQVSPDYAYAYNNRAIERANSGDRKGAITDYDRAIRLDPTFPKTYANRASVHAGLGNYQQAIADCTQAIQLDPTHARSYDIRGTAYFAVGDKQRAITDYDQAIRLAPKEASIYSIRGTVYFSMGDNKRALADYNQALKLDPNYAGAYWGRGDVYYNLGDYAKAIAEYDQAIRLKPNNSVVYLLRGRTYEKRQDRLAAIKDYDEAIRIDPKFARAYYRRGVAQSDLGNQKEAISDLRKAAALNKAAGNQAEYQRTIERLQKMGAI